jgi:hypothetical protein
MRKSLVLSFLIMLFSGVAAQLVQRAGASELTLTGTTEIPFTFGHGTWEAWNAGGLLVVENRFSAAPVFRTFDRHGKLVSQFTFSIPDAGLTAVTSFARAWDGSLVIDGTAISNDSRGASFVAWVSADGGEQSIVRTSPFVPSALTVAMDGTVWVAGSDVSRDRPIDHNQDLIRHYEKSGKLLGSYVPWSSLGTDFHTGPPSMRSIFVASKDRVGWYAPLAHMYIEFSLNGAMLSQVKTADHPKNDLVTVALCDDGGVFASTRIVGDNHQQTGWGIFTLDRQRGEWSYTRRDERWGMLLGCEGTTLASKTSRSTISWLDTSAK